MTIKEICGALIKTTLIIGCFTGIAVVVYSLISLAVR